MGEWTRAETDRCLAADVILSGDRQTWGGGRVVARTPDLCEQHGLEHGPDDQNDVKDLAFFTN